MKDALIYIIQNCQTAFEELKQLNSKLNSALDPSSITPEINRIGSLHRMTQDYLIVRVAGLFDDDSRVVSFEKICAKDQEYRNLRKEIIIEYLIKLRHTFSAHANLARMQNGEFPETYKILNSNLNEVLQKLLQVANRY